MLKSFGRPTTTVLRVESDLDAIVAGLLWWRDGVRSNAALARGISRGQGADQTEGRAERQGSQGSRKSGAENPEGSRATESKGQGGTAQKLHFTK